MFLVAMFPFFTVLLLNQALLETSNLVIADELTNRVIKDRSFILAQKRI